MKKIKTKGALALSQIFILIVGIIAISYAIGSEIRVVSAYSGVGDDKDPCIFSYNNIEYTIKNENSIRDNSNALIQKNNNDDWFYDANNNGLGDSGEFMSPLFHNMVNSYMPNCLESLKVEPEESETIEPPAAGLTVPTTGVDALLAAAALIDAEDKEIDEETKADALTKTCAELGGKKCQADEKCSENLIIAKDGACCRGTCEKKTLEGGDDEIKTPSSAEGAIVAAAAWKSLTGIVAGAGIAFGIYHGVRAAGGVLGFGEDVIDAASWAIGIGYFIGHTTVSLLGEGGILAGKGKIAKFLGTKWGGVVAGGIAAVIIFALIYKKESQETFTFTCQPWDANTGGQHCDECNQQGILPCSEYQCRSLGQACELVNPGTDEEKCVWVNRNDVEFPTIEAWDDALLSTEYEYTGQITGISPPDRGVKIEYNNGDIPAFTPLAFGITTDEPSKCKLDILRKDNFDDMSFYFSDGLFKTEHSYSLSLPGKSALEAEGIVAENDGEFEIFTRCQDANGNSNTANFVFQFKVDEGPDTTAPLIVTTDPLNNQPIAFEQSSLDITVYVNEPADCSWSHIDQNYIDMTPMTNCKTSIVQNAQMLYSCKATLEGLKDRVENRFYFRCKDVSENINTESYKFSLIGTQPLVIDSVAPNKTIKDSTDIIKVTLEATTSAGYNDGESNCYFSNTGEEDSYVMFLNTDSYQHSQELWLPQGNYEYFIRCIDLGGNFDTEAVSFSVETDIDEPVVVRAYKEESYLKIITDEPAKCVYDVKDCSYYPLEEGIKMTTMDDINHYTDWNTKTNFYIKCKDDYGKQPNPNECSITIRPFEIY